jgi:tRNA(His) 5'-end guanylyltransferase
MKSTLQTTKEIMQDIADYFQARQHDEIINCLVDKDSQLFVECTVNKITDSLTEKSE